MTADIVICELIDEASLAQIGPRWTYNYQPDLISRPDDLMASIHKAQALVVRSYAQVTPKLLNAGPKLKAIGRIGVGLDNIDLEACAARGIVVCSAPGENARSVGEYALTVAMMLIRNAYQAKSSIMAGEWPRTVSIGRELSGLTMGIIGLGATGQANADRARDLGMSVIASDPYLAVDHPAWAEVERTDLAGVLARADVLSLHVPLTDETRYIIDGDALLQMKPKSVVINAARGGVVDESALVGALKSGHLAGAALDVFEVEPLTAERAQMFENLSNLILTAHIAGVTEDSNSRVSDVCIRNVLAVLEGTR